MSQLYSLFLSPLEGKQVWRARLGGPQTPSDVSRSLSRMCIWWRCCKKVDVGEVSCLELQSAANPAWRVALGRRPWIWEDYKLLIGRNQWAEGWVLWLPACSGKGWPGQNGWLLRWMRRGKESPPWAFCQVARRTVDTTDSKSYTVADVQRALGIIL